MPFTFKIIADIIGLISFVLLPAFYTFSNYNGGVLIILFLFPHITHQLYFFKVFFLKISLEFTTYTVNWFMSTFK